jgi:TolB-like protein
MKRALLGLLLCATATAQTKPPLRVAVMDFTPAAPSEFDPLGAGLQSMVTTDLVQAPNVVLVERARLKDIQNELHLQQTGAVDKATAAKIGELTGASHLIVGSFTVAGGKMRLDARMFVVGSGEITLAEKMEGGQDKFFDLEKQLVGKIVDGLGSKPSRKQKQEMMKPETTNFEAFDAYSKGLVLMDEGKLDEAKAQMEQATQRDPNFALASQKLSEIAKLMPMVAELAKKAKPPETAPQCKPSSLLSPPCTQPNQPPPSPTTFNGPEGKSTCINVKQNGEQVTCSTPCQLNLAPGPADVSDCNGKVNKTITLSGPVTVKVSTKNQTNLIVGVVLGVVCVGSLAAAIGMSQVNASTSNAYEYYPYMFSLAAGTAYPAIHFLLRIGKNDVTATPLNAPH